MSLHLVGENLDKARAHYQERTGKLVQLMRGIYVDTTDDVDSTVLTHAVRIAKYLYPSTYLSAASAIALGPLRDGRLFLSGKRNLRTRIRSLEIIQNTAPAQPSLGSAIVADSMGEFSVDVSSIRQRLLEAFRLRSEHASSIDEDMRASVAARLIEEYGTAQAAADAAWALARENHWYREGERAERFLLKRPAHVQSVNAAAFDLTVAWHGIPVGSLVHDGFEWRWTPVEGSFPALIRQTTPGKLPPFIVSLLPEGWLDDVLGDKDERASLRSGRRYMSNITIVENRQDLGTLPQDILLTRLDQYSKNGLFTGAYAGPRRGAIEKDFELNLARIYERADTPRLSGVQIKAPMQLDAQGRLEASIGKPFTHILKPAGTGGYETLPLVEWTALTIGRTAGFEVPAIALIAMPDDMPPALLVERFDIRVGQADERFLALEDLASALDLSPDAKYTGTMERIARVVRALSTAAEEDLLLLLKRALFAWLIADGDMHLKNMALLKVAEPRDKAFRSIRLAPLYDSLTTRVFPRLARDRMSLKLNGKDDRLRRADFKAFSATAGIPSALADKTIDEVVQRVRSATSTTALPTLPTYGLRGETMIEEMLTLCRTRTEEFD